MAIIFKGKSVCGLCGKALAGKDIVRLPAISDVSHELYVYFDQGFHGKCFENWDKKEEAYEIIALEKRKFHESDYYKTRYNKYGSTGKTR